MKNKFLYLSLAVIAAFFISSCQKITDLNVNPNEPTKTTTKALLTGSEKQLMDNVWDEWRNASFGMLLSQYWAQNVYTDESRYSFRAGVNNSYWTQWYTGFASSTDDSRGGDGIHGFNEIIRLCTEEPENHKFYGDIQNQIAVARTLRAWMFQIITDVYGDIPYSQAMQIEKYKSPKYDKQADIYADLLKELKEASAQMDVSKEGPAGDLIYGGDMAMWKKFANSLRLRVAMRMADKDWATAKLHIEEAAPLAFTSNSDNALFHYGASYPNNNPLQENRKTRQDFASSSTMMDTMVALGDPRLPMYYAPAKNTGLFNPKIYGLSADLAGNDDMDDISQPSSVVLAADAPGVYMDYAEVCFIMAEAAERGASITGDATTWYTNGVTASMEYWGVNSTDIATYLAKPEVAYATASGDWKHKIGYQKWLALYMQGMQGWFEWRRLDFGVLQLPPNPDLEYIPIRLTYPTDEQGNNNANVTEASSRLDHGNNLNSHVWWDAN